MIELRTRAGTVLSLEILPSERFLFVIIIIIVFITIIIVNIITTITKIFDEGAEKGAASSQLYLHYHKCLQVIAAVLSL